jgi:hypothetical protein
MVCDEHSSNIACETGWKARPWLLYQAVYLRFVLSGCPTFFSLLLFSCFVHDGGVLVGFNLNVFKRFKWHGLCLFINALLLLPAIISHSIPMIIVYTAPRAIIQTIFGFKLCRFRRYSPFIIALCICLAAAVMSFTWLLNYVWENLRCCSSLCDGRAMLLIMQVVMKVLNFFRLQDFFAWLL